MLGSRMGEGECQDRGWVEVNVRKEDEERFSVQKS